MGAPRATDAAMRRALNAWKAAGLSVGKMEVTPEGHITITAPIVDTATQPEQTAGPKQWRKIG